MSGARIKDKEVLDNRIRGRIFRYITGNPGAHYNRIRTALGLNNGTLSYHLDVLEKKEYIMSVQDGYRRYYTVKSRLRIRR